MLVSTNLDEETLLRSFVRRRKRRSLLRLMALEAFDDDYSVIQDGGFSTVAILFTEDKMEFMLTHVCGCLP